TSTTGTPGRQLVHTDDLYLMFVAYESQVGLPGKLDDVRIYNRALSASEILSLSVVGPLAQNDSYGVTAGQTLNVAAPGVLGNDSAPVGASMTAVKDSDVSHG